jgi:serine/threonine-protein kinase
MPPTAEPNPRERALADHLLASGRLTRAQVDELYRIQHDLWKTVAVQKSLPQLLLDKEWIEPRELAEVLAAVRASGKIEAPPSLTQYRLEYRLADGSVSTIFRATRIADGRAVAIKLLEAPNNESTIKRFNREFSVASKLEHPHIVRVHEFGMEGTVFFIVMELVNGKDLGHLLRQDGAMTVSRALEITDQLADALDYAHRQLIVHRDIKPANILIGQDGLVRLTDFGFVKNEAPPTADSDTGLTATGAILGTPVYMAPEQARDPRQVDRRSDVYALGMTLVHMLTGENPFGEQGAVQILTELLAPGSTFHARIMARVLAPVRPLVSAMTHPDPARRVASCEEVRKWIARLQGALGWPGTWRAAK